MAPRQRSLRLAVIVGLLTLIVCVSSITAYTLWRSQLETRHHALNSAALHSRSFDDFLTQSLRVTELVATASLPHSQRLPAAAVLGERFVDAMRHTPFLRSMSLLDAEGRIVVSSNPANHGRHIATDDYQPHGAAELEILRLGTPWAGRDFADGAPSSVRPVSDESGSFFPVTRRLALRDQTVTLLMAINSDYFINHLAGGLNLADGFTDVLGYDGVVLLSTDPGRSAGTRLADEVARLRLTDVERGQLEHIDARGQASLAAFHASRLYPFVTLTRMDRGHALERWYAEAKTLSGIVAAALLLVVVITSLYYRRQVQAAVQRAEAARLQQINATVFGASADAIIITDAAADIVSVNTAFSDITGYSATEVVGRNPRLLASGRQDKAFYERLWQTLLGAGVWRGELINRRKDGRIYVARATITVVRDKAGQPLYFIGVTTDITAAKQAEEQIKLAASVFSHAREAIMITAPDATILDVNAAFTRITGFAREEVLGQNPRMLNSGRQSKDYYAAMWRDLTDKGHWVGEVWNRRKSGEVYAELLTISAVHDESGAIKQYVSLFSDITPLKAHQEQLEHIAHYDALTNLPNRVLLADRLHQAMIQAQRRKQRLAVAYLDLDGFKSINDHHGHDAGDHLLMTVATRMKQALREGDTLARLGGDEFVAVLLDLPDIDAGAPLLTRTLAAACQPVAMGELTLHVSASVGVTFYPQDDEIEADQLLRQADQAMYQAKLAGKNRYHVFDAEHDRYIRDRIDNLEQIRRALDANEFVLHYQPKVNMRSGELIGVEALVRWQTATGLRSPASFLPAIEDHPLIIELGEWVMDRALTQVGEWQQQGLRIPVSVNLGARHLQQTDFVYRLQLLLAAHPELPPGALEMEVLETSALEDLVQVSAVIDACRSLGVRFSLDDFGTGYSSLTYLKRLAVAQLKIDQSFVRDMLVDSDDLAILDGVLGLATAFRREVIAEGVEIMEHGEMLLELGCELAQGYFIARPMPADAIPLWLADWKPPPAWSERRQVRSKDVPALFAIVEHRAWIAALDGHLRGKRDCPPPPGSPPVQLRPLVQRRWRQALQPATGLHRGGPFASPGA